jgi:hypothetical protein
MVCEGEGSEGAAADEDETAETTIDDDPMIKPIAAATQVRRGVEDITLLLVVPSTVGDRDGVCASRPAARSVDTENHERPVTNVSHWANIS